MNDKVTIIFVSFYSEKKILQYLKHLDNNFKVIVIDNANDNSLNEKLQKFSNLQIIVNKENIGFGAATNQGLNNVETEYALHLDIDSKIEIDSINKMVEEADKINEFAILGPLIVNHTYKEENYIKKNYEKNYNLMNFLEGCCLFFNMNEMKEIGFFDENIFLYFEEVDLIKRCLKQSKRIIMIDNITIEHKGRSSVDEKFNVEIEINRNWHYMWSKFYYHKKHFSYLYAFFKIIRHIISGFFKFIFYSLSGNNNKKSVYKARLSGCINGVLLKKSWFRPKI